MLIVLVVSTIVKGEEKSPSVQRVAMRHFALAAAVAVEVSSFRGIIYLERQHQCSDNQQLRRSRECVKM